MSGHEQYEELCALAASGLASEAELAGLIDHLRECHRCRLLHAEFTSLLNSRLPLADAGRRSSIAYSDTACLERFIERAREEGIPLKREFAGISRWSLFWYSPVPRYALAGVAAACLIFSLGTLAANHETVPAAAKTVAASQQTVTVPDAKLVARAAPVPPSEGRPAAGYTALLRELQAARESATSDAATIARMELDSRLATDRVSKLEDSLKATALDLQEAQDLNAGLQRELTEKAQQLVEAKAQSEKATAAKSDADSSLLAQRARIVDLSEQVRIQQTTLDMERNLVAAGRDVRDLMAARDLRIVDVHDFDTHGKAQKSFGRIFYTQGKSLIFYAFDLDDKKAGSTKVSFQAWGQKLGSEESTRSLGIFYSDDKTQNRWVLKVDDPNLLREIDTVFVTFEAPGGRTPRGSPLLHAFLGSKINHP
jgi:hypothetical protein